MAAAEALMSPPRSDTMRSDASETASIRSAAPSYFSEAPSYRSMLDPPPYTPRATPPYSATPPTPAFSSRPRPSRPPPQPLTSINLSPAPRMSAAAPNLNHFNVSNWPSLNSNPNVRIYNTIAQRRITRDYESAMASFGPMLGGGSARPRQSTILEQLSETPEEPLRPLEDPHLVGEEAASRARAARLERERMQDVLVAEDQHWDQFLSQVSRDRSAQERAAIPSAVSSPLLSASRSPRQRRGLLRRLGTLGRFL